MVQIQFHHAEFRALAQATEDESKVARALAFVTGEGMPVQREEQQGHHHNRIVLLTARTERTAEVRAFLDRLSEDSGVLAQVEATLEARMDEEGTLYLRLSKQEAFLGRLALAAGAQDDAVQVRMKVATYPARGEVARARLREHLARLAARKAK